MPRSPDSRDQKPKREQTLAPLITAFTITALATGLLLAAALNLP